MDRWVPPQFRAKENRCSFCGKSQSQVRLIAGPGVFICSQCVALCNEVLAHDAAVTAGTPPDPPAGPPPGGAVARPEITQA